MISTVVLLVRALGPLRSTAYTVNVNTLVKTLSRSSSTAVVMLPLFSFTANEPLLESAVM